MADKGDKGKTPVSRGKTAAKSLPKRQGSVKGKDSISFKKKRVVLESSDSDSEGFIEEKSPTSLEVNDKTPSDVRSSKKKVSFDELKSGGKASNDTPTNKGDSGKSGSGKAGGKGDSGKVGSGKSGGKGYSGDSGKAGSGKAGGKGYSGKGGGKESFPYSGKGGEKGSLPRATPLKVPVTEVELKLELELPKSVNTRVLMDCEATDILQGIQEHLSDLAEDPTIKIPESFDKALEYSKISNHYTTATAARQILDTLKSSGVTSGEICMIGNICPDSVEEVYALLPSLKANRIKNEGPIKDVLAELAMLKTM